MSLEDTLQRIVVTARDTLPGFDHVGLSTVDRHHRMTTRAVTSDLVSELDALQYGLREGPCVDAMVSSITLQVVPHIRHEQRWPRYVPSATQQGLRSQLAVKLSLDVEGTLGGLNLYSTVSEEIHPEAVPLAQAFAAHAAIALAGATYVSGLNDALVTRTTIGQAMGILMERYNLDEDQAFAFLVRTASHGNIKLRDVARELVEQKGRELVEQAGRTVT